MLVRRTFLSLLALIVVSGVAVAADTRPPSKPPDLSATAVNCQQVDLAWNVSSDRGGSGTLGYYVFRVGAGGLRLTASRSYSDTGAPESSSLTYRVYAFDAAGNLSNPSQRSVTTPACNTPPVANAGADRTAVVGTPVTWDGSGSVDPDGTIISYQWNFGDWSAAAGQTVSHTYSQPGVYRIILTVYDDDESGSGDEAYVEIVENDQTNQPPVANAGPGQTADVGAQVTFNGSGSYDPDGTITSYQWSFGDGGSATGGTVSHTYSQPGTYQAVLTVHDDGGVSSSDAASVVIEEPSTATGGETMWSMALGTSSVEVSGSVTTDSGDNVLVTGVFVGSTNVGGSNLTSAGSSDLFLARYFPSGDHDWSRAIGGPGGEIASGIAVDASGDPIVVGYFDVTTDLGDGPLVSAGARDIFVAKYSWRVVRDSVDPNHVWQSDLARRLDLLGDHPC